MSDHPVILAALAPAPAGYADWLAELKSRSLPSIEAIERELAHVPDANEGAA